MNPMAYLSAVLLSVVLAGCAGRSSDVVGVGKDEKFVRENLSQVQRLNVFANELLQIHRYRMDTRNIRKTERIGGYVDDPEHFKDIAYYDAATDRLLTRIRWENKLDGLPEMIEVYFYDKQGALRVDYLAIFLPGHRNAPFSALINVHRRGRSLTAFRQFDVFGDILFERCRGERDGKNVDLSLNEMDIPPSTDSVPETLYRACFGQLPKSAGQYVRPTTLIPALKKASISRRNEPNAKVLERRIADTSRKIADNPKDAELYAQRGHAYFLLQDLDKAIDDFNNAISLNDTLDAAYFGRGMAYGRNRQFDRAIEDLSVYIERNPLSSLAYTKRGVRYIWKKDFESARVDLEMAISLDSRNAEAHDDLGVALAQLGRIDEAVGHFNRSKALDPTYQKAHHNLALVLYLAGDLEEALPAADDAIRLQPDNRGSLALKGAILEGLGRKREARAIKAQAEVLPQGNWDERSALR